MLEASCLLLKCQRAFTSGEDILGAVTSVSSTSVDQQFSNAACEGKINK